MNRILITRMIRTNQAPKSTSFVRWSSSDATAAGQKPVSPHIGFYKTFARPIAKVLLMATLTYQMAYWAWVKLEKDEIRAEREAEISALEHKLSEVMKTKKP
ncbi:hypothetical protein F5884DRAFT_419530 [Xylogone sp. PMI_703]|nr:hypothetical protein F5884DRAFT_419530 [Xylogone sp. PMI_703]